jgi:UDP-N-acetylglucosamine transferase subunit ALG13
LIFVTVGTSLPHDGLIEAIDKLVEQGEITDEVIAQRGAGNYIPRHIKSFRFKKGLGAYLSKAEIIISNCGAGTIIENATKGRKLVVIQNPDITGGHEWEIVTKMERGKHLIWCKGEDQLKDAIEKARSMDFRAFQPTRLDLCSVLRELMVS